MKWLHLLWRHRVYAMGLIGWAVIAHAYPIGWSLPTYAAY